MELFSRAVISFIFDGNGKVYATMGSEQISLKRLRRQFLLFEEPATQLKFAKFILEKKNEAKGICYVPTANQIHARN